jgi:hypothetical protein
MSCVEILPIPGFSYVLRQSQESNLNVQSSRASDVNRNISLFEETGFSYVGSFIRAGIRLMARRIDVSRYRPDRTPSTSLKI